MSFEKIGCQNASVIGPKYFFAGAFNSMAKSVIQQTQRHKNLLAACPKPNCLVKCNIAKMENHFKKNHQELLAQNGDIFRRNFKNLPARKFNKDKKVHMLKYNKQIYLLMIYFTGDIDKNNRSRIGMYSLNFGLFYLRDEEIPKGVYDLTVTLTDTQAITFKWHDMKPEEYDDVKHCLACLDQSCELGHQQKPHMFLKNKIHNLKNNDSTILLEYAFKLKGEEGIKSNTCQKCFKNMPQPFYVCLDHKFCSTCAELIKNCQICNVPLKNSTKFCIDEILDVEVCCRNASRGCGYAGTMKNLEEHLKQCLYNYLI